MASSEDNRDTDQRKADTPDTDPLWLSLYREAVLGSKKYWHLPTIEAQAAKLLPHQRINISQDGGASLQYRKTKQDGVQVRRKDADGRCSVWHGIPTPAELVDWRGLETVAKAIEENDEPEDVNQDFTKKVNLWPVRYIDDIIREHGYTITEQEFAAALAAFQSSRCHGDADALRAALKELGIEVEG